MAYNNVFPVSYQPMYYPQQFQQQTPVPTPNVQPNQGQTPGGLIWVQGEAGAKSYLVAPNNTVQLWDSESQTIYLKSADASGMPSMKILDYTIRNSEQLQVSQPINSIDGYVTVDEFNKFKNELSRIKGELSKLQEVKHESEHDE